MNALAWLEAVPVGEVIEVEFRHDIWARILRTNQPTEDSEWLATLSRATISTERLARITEGKRMRLRERPTRATSNAEAAAA